MKRYRGNTILIVILFLILIGFTQVGIAEENITSNATLYQESLKDEAEKKYELAGEKYDEISKIGVARGGGGFRERVYLDIERAREELENGNYGKSIEYSETAIETADQMIKSAGSTINLPVIGEIREQLVFMFFMAVMGAVVLYLIMKDTLRKREQKRYYGQLSSKTILKKPKRLKKFAEDEDSSIRIKVSEIIRENFDEIPANLREELICILAEDGYGVVRVNISEMMIEKFNTLPKELRERILIKFLVDIDWSVRGDASEIIGENFDNIPKELREESLKKLAEDKNREVRSHASDAVKWNIEHISQNMKITVLKNFAEDEYSSVRYDAVDIVYRDFINIPKNLREDLTRKLLNDESSLIREQAQKIISKHLKDLPADIIRCPVEMNPAAGDTEKLAGNRLLSVKHKIDVEDDVCEISKVIESVAGENKESAVELVNVLDLGDLKHKLDGAADVRGIGECVERIAWGSREVAGKLVGGLDLEKLKSKLCAEEDIEKIGVCIFGLAWGSKDVAGELLPVLENKIYAEEDAEKITSCVEKIALESQELASKLIEQIDSGKAKTPEVKGKLIELKRKKVKI